MYTVFTWKHFKALKLQELCNDSTFFYDPMDFVICERGTLCVANSIL